MPRVIRLCKGKTVGSLSMSFLSTEWEIIMRSTHLPSDEQFGITFTACMASDMMIMTTHR